MAGSRQDQGNAYDALQRLIGCTFTDVDPATGSSVLREDAWDLDLLGNWTERVMNSDVAPDAIDEHAVNNRNIIESLTRTVGGSPVTTEFRYDAAGNLQFDGEYAYQYDAWGRLLQINEATLGIGSPPPLVLGNLVKHFAYDGLGRLIRVQSPYPAPGYAGGVRSERLFYDGIRRIQEVVIDPVNDTEDAAMAGDPAAIEALAFNPDLDGDVATLGTENSQTESSGGGSPPPGVTLEREYIWGPGDNGVDELLVQYDRNRAAWWVLQDAGLDAIALCDSGGTSGTARIVWQATYDAYGSALTAEQLYAHAYLRAGHKGLFFDRLDVGVMHPSTGLEEKRLEPGAKLIVQVRNRAYAPDLGRFVQGDPNASGQNILERHAHNGIALGPSVLQFDLSARYADACSLYSYMSSNPTSGADPLGLFIEYIDPAGFFTETGNPFNLQFDIFAATDPGGMVQSMLASMVEQYASNMEYDVDWALDWSAPDDWHTRTDNSWIQLSMYAGVGEHFGVNPGTLSGGANPIIAGATAAKGSLKGGRGMRLKPWLRKRIRDATIYRAKEGYAAGLTHAGDSLKKHPDFFDSTLKPHHDPSVKELTRRIGGRAQDVNRVGQAITERYVKTGVPYVVDSNTVAFIKGNRAVGAKFDDAGNLVRVVFRSPSGQ